MRRIEPQVRQPPHETADGDDTLPAGQRLPRTGVDAAAEGQVRYGRYAIEGELLVEVGLVAVRRPEVDHEPGAAWDSRAADVDLARGDAEQPLRGRLQTEDLLDGRRDQLG